MTLRKLLLLSGLLGSSMAYALVVSAGPPASSWASRGLAGTPWQWSRAGRGNDAASALRRGGDENFGGTASASFPQEIRRPVKPLTVADLLKALQAALKEVPKSAPSLPFLVSLRNSLADLALPTHYLERVTK